jgi:hypothetical protein
MRRQIFSRHSSNVYGSSRTRIVAGVRRSDADELSNRSVFVSTLEAHHEPKIERGGEPLERSHARRVLSALDPRDGGMARAHPTGELGLRQREV